MRPSSIASQIMQNSIIKSKVFSATQRPSYSKPPTEKMHCSHIINLNRTSTRLRSDNFLNAAMPLFNGVHRNAFPKKLTHMEQSVTEFQNYLRTTQKRIGNRRTTRKVVSKNSTDFVQIEKDNYVAVNSLAIKKRLKSPLFYHRHSQTAHPIFLYSRNPNSQVINAKSIIGMRIDKFRQSISSRLYRVNRGDASTIAPIIIPKSIKLLPNQHLCKRSLSIKRSDYCQTDNISHLINPIKINCMDKSYASQCDEKIEMKQKYTDE